MCRMLIEARRYFDEIPFERRILNPPLLTPRSPLSWPVKAECNNLRARNSCIYTLHHATICMIYYKRPLRTYRYYWYRGSDPTICIILQNPRLTPLQCRYKVEFFFFSFLFRSDRTIPFVNRIVVRSFVCGKDRIRTNE